MHCLAVLQVLYTLAVQRQLDTSWDLTNYSLLVALFRHARIHRRSRTICFFHAEPFRDCADESLLAESGTVVVIGCHGPV